MNKGALKTYSDIIIPTKHGALYCAYFNRTGEVQGCSLTNGVHMSIAKAYALLDMEVNCQLEKQPIILTGRSVGVH